MEISSCYSSKSLQGSSSYLPRRPPCRRIWLPRRGVMQPKACATRENDNCDCEFLRRAVDHKRVKLQDHVTSPEEDVHVPKDTWNRIEWEKEYRHTFLKSNFCEIHGLMQLDPPLRKRRQQGLTIGFTVMLTLCMPTSVLVMLLYLLDAAKDLGFRLKGLEDEYE